MEKQTAMQGMGQPSSQPKRKIPLAGKILGGVLLGGVALVAFVSMPKRRGDGNNNDDGGEKDSPVKRGQVFKDANGNELQVVKKPGRPKGSKKKPRRERVEALPIPASMEEPAKEKHGSPNNS